MSDEPIRITLPGMRVSVIRDEDKGIADYFDARGDSRSAWNEWEEWVEFAKAILAVRGQMP